MEVSFGTIVPWGRSRKEYQLMFNLAAADISRGVLNSGGGPASFAAEMAAYGIRAVFVDPIYACSGQDILARFEEVVDPMMSQVRATPEDWVWGSTVKAAVVNQLQV